MHHFHSYRIFIFDNLFRFLLFLGLLFNSTILEFFSFFSLCLFFSLFLVECLFINDIFLFYLFVFADQVIPHTLKIVTLKLDSPEFNCWTWNCKFFTTLFCKLFCINIYIILVLLKLFRPETVVMKFFFPLFFTSITIYLSFRVLVFVSLTYIPSAFP